MKLKIYSAIVILYASLLPNIYSQHRADESNAQKDWDYFSQMRMVLYTTDEEKSRFEDPNLLEYSKFIDEVYTKRSKVVEAFLAKYPNSEHYQEALGWFLNLYLMPLFITEVIDDNHMEFLSKFTGNSRYGPKVAPFYRALPIDDTAMELWIEKGNTLVMAFLKSDASLEDKFTIEKKLLSRDIILASRWYEGLEKDSKSLENDYWQKFNLIYWESFRLRTENLIKKYSNLEPVAHLVQRFIEYVAQTCHSDRLKEYYWESFYTITAQTFPNENHIGLKEVHNKAKETLKAMNEFAQYNQDQPIDITFTAMDGTKVDLANMRGKVVLIDFWSTRCSPCIKEMPHLKAMYDKYRSQGFEVIGIAADGDSAKTNIIKITNKNNATWPQHLDKGKKTLVSYHELYDIGSLPTVWLLDKKGRLVDRNARGERLEPLIRKYLDLDQ